MIHMIVFDFVKREFTVYRTGKPIYKTYEISDGMRRFIKDAELKTNGEQIIYEKRKNV